MFAIIFWLILLAYSGINFYIGNRLLRWLRLLAPSLHGAAFWIPYSVLAVLFIIVRMLPASAATPVVDRIGNWWLGIFVYGFLLVMLLDIFRLFGRLMKTYPAGTHIQIATGGVVLAALLGIMIYGRINARNIKITDYSVTLKGGGDSLNIVMFADMHLGYTNGLESVKDTVEKVNAQKPDIVCIVGDVFDGNYDAVSNIDKVIAEFRKIDSKYGVYAVMGNHDAGKTYSKMAEFFGKANIKLLEDEALLIDGRFTVAGMRDGSPIGHGGESRTDIANVISTADSDKPIILLNHKPSDIPEAEKAGVDLMLSGHTHGGQVFPANFITNAIFEEDCGHLVKNGFQAIVTSGVGTWGPPIRIGSRSEIVSIRVDF